MPEPRLEQRNSVKNITRVVLGTALILTIPLVAMQFTEEVDWNFSDFVIIGTLLIGAGVVYELIASKLMDKTHRTILGLVLVAAVILIWADLAVGIFGLPFSGQLINL